MSTASGTSDKTFPGLSRVGRAHRESVRLMNVRSLTYHSQYHIKVGEKEGISMRMPRAFFRLVLLLAAISALTAAATSALQVAPPPPQASA